MQLRMTASLVALLVLAIFACSEGGSVDGALAQAGTDAPPVRAAPPSAGPCRLTLGWEPQEPYEYRSVERRRSRDSTSS